MHRHIIPAQQMPAQQIQHQQQPITQQQPPSIPQQQANQQQPTPTQAQQAPASGYAPIAQAYQYQQYPQQIRYTGPQIPYPGAPYSAHVPNYQQAQYHPTYSAPTWPVAAPNYLPISQTPTTAQPVRTVKTREKNPAKVKNPKTGQVVPLGDSSLSGKTQSTHSASNKDTAPSSAATTQSTPTNTTPPSKNVTIKAPPTTVTATGATTRASQLASSTTTKSSSVAQTASTQAQPLSTRNNDKNLNASSSQDPSSVKESTPAATIDKTKSNEAASSLAVQNEFACKVSERLAGLDSVENKSNIRQDGKRSTGVKLSVVDEVDHTKDGGKGIVADEHIGDNGEIINKENNSKKEITTDQTQIDIVNENTNEKSDVKDIEVVEEGSKTTSDDSNKENVDGSDQSVEGAALHYEPGQYNPKTKSGKKKYDKKFLMAIYDIILKEVISTAADPLNFPLQSYDFTPEWSKNPNHNLEARSNDPLRRQNQSYYCGRSSDRQERFKRVIPTGSLGQEVELKTVSNPWKPASVVKPDTKVDESTANIENLRKQFRSILNKLTPNNFDSLADKVTKLEIDTEDKLGDVIDIVFAKALSEPGYSVLYGRMCSHLQKIAAGKAAFGNTLLRRCQNQFQADIYSGIDVEARKKQIEEEQDADKKKHMNEELYEDMYRCRMRGLGLIKFIGELYKIEMLNEKIMFDCINRLFIDITDESLECLCDLLMTIGEKLDKTCKAENLKQKNHQGTPRAYQGGQKSAAAIVKGVPEQQPEQQQQTLDPIFERLHKIRKDNTNNLSLRIRFKLLDICELREKENWHSKKAKDNNPKKIDEIRVAHEEKLAQEARRNEKAAMGPRRSQEGRRNLGQSGGSSSHISSLNNDLAGNRVGGMHMSASSHSIRDHSLGDDMKTSDIVVQKHHQDQKQMVLTTIKNRIFATSASGESNDLRPTRKM